MTPTTPPCQYVRQFSQLANNGFQANEDLFCSAIFHNLAVHVHGYIYIGTLVALLHLRRRHCFGPLPALRSSRLLLRAASILRLLACLWGDIHCDARSGSSDLIPFTWRSPVSSSLSATGFVSFLWRVLCVIDGLDLSCFKTCFLIHLRRPPVGYIASVVVLLGNLASVVKRPWFCWAILRHQQSRRKANSWTERLPTEILLQPTA